MDNNSNAQTKTCPFCAEDIKPTAIICKHCGSNLAIQAEAPAFREHNFKLGRCIYCDVSSTNAMTYRSACKPAPRRVESVAKIMPQITLPPPVNLTLSEPQLLCPKCKSTQLTAQKKRIWINGRCCRRSTYRRGRPSRWFSRKRKCEGNMLKMWTRLESGTALSIVLNP